MKRRHPRDLHADVQRGGNDLVAQLKEHEEGLDEVQKQARNGNDDVCVWTPVPEHGQHSANQTNHDQQNEKIEHTAIQQQERV